MLENTREPLLPFEEIPSAEKMPQVAPEPIRVKEKPMKQALIEEGELQIKYPKEIITIPEDIEYGILEEAGIQVAKIRVLIESMVNFLNLPVIIDKFGINHEARRQYRAAMEKRFGVLATEYLGNSKLRKAKTQNIYGPLSKLIPHLGISKAPIAKEFEPVISVLCKRLEWIHFYDLYSFEFKVACIQEADRVAREVIELFRKK